MGEWGGWGSGGVGGWGSEVGGGVGEWGSGVGGGVGWVEEWGGLGEKAMAFH